MNGSYDLAAFLGRFHPLLVHLPIGLIALLCFLELLAKRPRFRHANGNAGLILACAVPLSIVTALFGWLLSRSGGYDQSLLQWHFWTGIATAAACFVAGLLYWLDLQRFYRLSLYVSVAALIVCSHFGGSLTHGNGYLTQYAPARVRQVLGLPTRTISKTGSLAADSGTTQTNSPKPSLFADSISPFLQQNCVQCHGPEKAKGKLRMDSYAALLKGGDAGPVLVPGKSSESEMIRRMLLPLENDEHMPPDGKPQPTRAQISMLRAWIDAGAPEDKTAADLKVQPSLAKAGNQEQNKTDETALKLKSRTELQPLVATMEEELGAVITPLGENEPWFQCNASLIGNDFGDAELAKLSPLAQNLKKLDIAGTAVTDAGLQTVGAMTNLTHLHLERTRITDTGLEALINLTSLEYLNLYATAIGDAGLSSLQKLPKLKHLYLWQTKVTPQAAKAFLDSRIDKEQLQEWETEIAQLQSRIRESQVTVDLGSVSTSMTASTTSTGTNAVPVNTECPVSGKPLVAGKTTTYEGKLVGFCCDDCKSKFESDPKPFLSKLGWRESK